MKLIHVDLSKDECSSLPDAFIYLIKTKRGIKKFIFRIPLVHKMDRFYDICSDSFIEDVWCTPVIVITSKFKDTYEVYFNLHSDLKDS